MLNTFCPRIFPCNVLLSFDFGGLGTRLFFLVEFILDSLQVATAKKVVLDKLLDCGKEFELVRASVEYGLKQDPEMSYFKIMGEYVAYEQRMGLQSSRPHPGAHMRQQGQNASGAGGGQQQGDVLIP